MASGCADRDGRVVRVVDVSLVQQDCRARRFLLHAPYELLDRGGIVRRTGRVVRVADVDKACATRSIGHRREVERHAAIDGHRLHRSADAFRHVLRRRVGGGRRHQRPVRRAERPHAAFENGTGSGTDDHARAIHRPQRRNRIRELVHVVRRIAAAVACAKRSMHGLDRLRSRPAIVFVVTESDNGGRFGGGGCAGEGRSLARPAGDERRGQRRWCQARGCGRRFDGRLA